MAVPAARHLRPGHPLALPPGVRPPTRRHRRGHHAPRSRGLREPPVTAGGSNIVVGFGTELWRRLRPNDVPADSGPFETIEGAGHTAPATQHDIWVWTHGTGEDVELDIARGDRRRASRRSPRSRSSSPASSTRTAATSPASSTAPRTLPVEEAHNVAIIPDGQPGEGGAHVIAHEVGAQPRRVPRARRRGPGRHHRPHQARQRRARRQARHRAHQPAS